MRPIDQRTLYWVSIGSGLLGQFLLDSSPKPAIVLCGIALVASLLKGWWYLDPIGSNWWYPALVGGIGLTMWDEPRGWFFMAWSAVIIGTGLRAQHIWRSFETTVAEEQARVKHLKEMGFEPESDLVEAAPAEPEAVPPPLPPIPLWRYPVALAMGLTAAWVGAWCTRIVYLITHWQIDLLAYLIGYLVGKAVAAGAGDRSSRALQWMAALLSAAGVVYARYLLISWMAFNALKMKVTPAQFIALAIDAPGKILGLFLVAFVALGGWAGWHYARVPGRESRTSHQTSRSA